MSFYAAANPNAIPAPHIEYRALLPMLIVFGVACAGVLVEAFVPRAQRALTQTVLALGGLVAALIAVVSNTGLPRKLVAQSAIAADGPTLFIQGTILALSIGALLLIADRSIGADSDFVAQAADLPGSEQERASVQAGLRQTEVFPLAMFAVGGMMLFPAANDLITAFVALEVLSLPLYLLAGMARRRRLLSQEAAVKYFLLGAFSSAFFVYGLALVYGYAKSVEYGDIATALTASDRGDSLIIVGLALIGISLLFKLSGVPFHWWTPDVYQGAPTPITAFMAAGTKVAAFGALLRVFFVAFGGLAWDWRPVIWGVAIATMVVGAILGITQTDVKRLLAYSSIAHAGFVLTAFAATTRASESSVLFYLVAYGFMTIGAFAIVILVRDGDGEANHLSRWVGLGRRSPLVAGIFALFLLAMAGLPPTSGLWAKVAVFTAAYQGGAGPLVIVGVLASAVTAYYYLRIIVLMFAQEPAVEGPTVAVPGALASAAIALGVIVTVVLGIVPQPVLDLADKAVPFLR
ncbi:NADH dehydrogenase subunit N [Acidothermus cellulolyticus 11B]|uniref:NADH-quinone oxidoreductase subunit N n=1 Tax=Acidothermus cellulolyticus (strain ATCC 43068 / DSM 8971 / 11B) TaxID=351607 RepID=NUON_ACIC1|nr:NADH-quinone oxidoreductase subunit NuoN [Acidothermus cellulolyticus]A0LRJ4.1 RecName: Full=NADH-quinone oxidoreductase subunit N; AltName: Full=NADH dehydrogenase I subunit N; AltName: Full=NDH-1 subunit N [Acidothermus cellulolyticus 11B]ABK52054.1 NADH dehydrogenase subunit N [Acidothermus cellulolyticus 11B]